MGGLGMEGEMGYGDAGGLGNSLEEWIEERRSQGRGLGGGSWVGSDNTKLLGLSFVTRCSVKFSFQRSRWLGKKNLMSSQLITHFVCIVGVHLPEPGSGIDNYLM